MALDPSIPLQGGTVPDLLSAVQGGLSLSQQIRNQPLREALMRRQAERLAMSEQGQTPADLQTFNELVRLSQSSDPMVAKAAQIRLRLLPGAGAMTGQERIAQDPALTGQVAQSGATIAGATERAKLEEKLEVQPSISRAVTEATESAKRESKQATEQRSNEKAFSVYRSALSNLTKSFGEAATGPGFGLIPAIGKDARILEGAIAIMRPTLKQIFRTAGEGTFTDKDQEQLDAMLPSRSDSPEVAQAKLNFIDSVVRSKFEIDDDGTPDMGGQSSQSAPTVTTQEQYDALPSGSLFIEDGVQYRKP